MKKKEPVLLFDQLNKVYVKICLGKDKKWERWVSDTKKKWVLTHNSLSLDDVIKLKEEVVANNYNNLYSLILHKS